MSSEPDTDRDDAPSGLDRREFLKGSVGGWLGVRGAVAGAAGAGAIGAGAYAHHKTKGTVRSEFPVPVQDDYTPVDQRNTLFTYASSRKLQEEHPERQEKFDGFDFFEAAEGLRTRDRSEPPRPEAGYSQLDRALEMGGLHANKALAPGEQLMVPNTGVGSWDQSNVAPTQYQFGSPVEAAIAIKSAARVYNATRCGITKRDRRWDYDPLYDVTQERTITWDEFPFEPKTVVVCLVEMDYPSLAASPSWASLGTVMEGYTMAMKVAGQMAEFFRQLGYHAVAAGNDLGMSVPYGIAAGLGEGARNGTLIAPRIGPRHRISKVYTDFELVDYDQPRTFGIQSFCQECKRCAESCPSEAITFDSEPSWGPNYESAEDPDVSWNNNPGVLKFHNDAKKCYRFWSENGGGCSNCITSCPYNKPDFWHHAFTDSMNVIVPGPAHAFMREMDKVFGYGTTFDETDVVTLWRLGANMRGG